MILNVFYKVSNTVQQRLFVRRPDKWVLPPTTIHRSLYRRLHITACKVLWTIIEAKINVWQPRLLYKCFHYSHASPCKHFYFYFYFLKRIAYFFDRKFMWSLRCFYGCKWKIYRLQISWQSVEICKNISQYYLYISQYLINYFYCKHIFFQLVLC